MVVKAENYSNTAHLKFADIYYLDYIPRLFLSQIYSVLLCLMIIDKLYIAYDIPKYVIPYL